MFVILLWQEAIERSSFFEPQKEFERGNVAEAFKSVDKIHEGRSVFFILFYFCETERMYCFLCLPEKSRLL